MKAELETGGLALPWSDIEGFLRRVLELALEDHAQAGVRDGWVFFDRGLIDAAAGIERVTGRPIAMTLGPAHRTIAGSSSPHPGLRSM